MSDLETIEAQEQALTPADGTRRLTVLGRVLEIGQALAARLLFRPTPIYRRAAAELCYHAGGPENVEAFLAVLSRYDRTGLGIWRVARTMTKRRDEALDPPSTFQRLPREFRTLLNSYIRSPWYARLLRRWVVPVYTAAIAASVGYAVLTITRHMYRRGLQVDWNWAAYAFTRSILLLSQMDELLRAWIDEAPMDAELRDGFRRMIIASGHVTATLRHASSTCRHVLHRSTTAPDPLLAHRSILRTAVLAADFLFAISGMKALLAAGGAEANPEADLPGLAARMPVMYPRLHNALARWYAPPSLGGRARPARIYLPRRGQTPYWEHPDVEQAVDSGHSLLEELPDQLRGFQAILLNDMDLESVISCLVPESSQATFDVLTQFTSDLLEFGHSVWRLQAFIRRLKGPAQAKESIEAPAFMDRATAVRILWGATNGTVPSSQLLVAAQSLLSMAPPVPQELANLWAIAEAPHTPPAMRWAGFVTFARLARYLVDESPTEDLQAPRAHSAGEHG